MKVDQEFIEGVLGVGKLTLEDCVANGEDYAPKLLAEYDGELHVILVAGGYDVFMKACRMLLDLRTQIGMLAFTVDSYIMKAHKKQYGQGDMGEDTHAFVPGTL